MANLYEIFEFLEADNTESNSARTIRKRRRLEQREQSDPFNLDDREFVKRYRLTKGQIHELCDELRPHMPNPKKSTDLSVETKVLIALSFYATGSYQRPTGSIEGHYVAQQTVSSVIAQVTSCLNVPELREKYIKFPVTDQERNRIKMEFNNKFHIPGVLGCIDCTPVAIVRPVLHADSYFCRKQYHSLNVQLICDANMQIMSVDAGNPGATHDSYIWSTHPLSARMQNLSNREETWFLELHMISGARTKRIRIDITTYKNHKNYPGNEMDNKANKKCCSKGHHNTYVCAVCLNSRTEGNAGEYCKKLPKSCPLCQKSKDCNGKIKERETLVSDKETFCMMRNKTKDCREKSPDTQHKFSECSEVIKGRLAVEKDRQRKDPNVKTVQTSDTNVAQGLTLLNEVLTVFQNKKVDINKDKVKSRLLKDAAVSTTDKKDERSPKDKPRLSVSTFQYSIDDKKNVMENGKFTLVNCCQPVYLKTQNSLDLNKHKSCSIPQMKLEELKYSLKEKSRSKDAIEEVNRMFATVRKSNKNSDYSNRPMVRSGPRVLPLVKSHPEKNKKDFGAEYNDSCKCCQTCMSSGDSFAKNECYHDTDKETCDKCVYKLCCHYEKKHKVQTGVLICEHCRDFNDEQSCQNCVDDSG